MRARMDYGPLAGRVELKQVRDILTQSFEFPISQFEMWLNAVGREQIRRITRSDRVIAALAFVRMGQWFGRRAVPMVGIAAVGVPPEDRASGAAFHLMSESLKELRAEGTPISTLYPATQRLYRKVGYEQAGFRCRHSVPTRSIPRFPRELPCRRIDGSKTDAFHKPYDLLAERNSGMLHRNQAMWQRVVTVHGSPVYGYLFGTAKEPEGYVVFTQEKLPEGYDLHLRDLVAVTPRAARAVWTFLSDHRSLAKNVHWLGPAAEPLLGLLPEQDACILSSERWFLRIVDVAAALEARGYPEDVEATITIEIEDEILPENRGRWVLHVADGRGRVERPRRARAASAKGGEKLLRLHIRSLAPLYSGLFTPRQSASLGWIDAAPDALSAAAAIFAGPEPWMPDAF